jgi:NADPH:quinone reductase-like Zn-dependent oxidoreductase
MKRWELKSLGAANLHLTDAAQPTPAAGEVLVRVGAVSLNFRDGMIVENGANVALNLPFTPLSDMAGEVVALGEGVTRFAVGDKVISIVIPGWIDGVLASRDIRTQGGPIPGMLSEYLTTPAEWLVRAPSTLSATEASTLPLAALTAWMAVVELGRIRAGQTVVVQGTGGVSIFALQFAAAHNARAIITSGSDEKLSRAMQLGATDGINRRTKSQWHEKVIELTGGRGADHVLEMAGGDNFARSVQAVAAGGRVSIIGLLESAELRAPIMPIIYGGVSIVGVSIGPRRVLEDMVRAIDQSGVRPVIDTVYDFESAREAFAHLKRGAFGKIVVKVR